MAGTTVIKMFGFYSLQQDEVGVLLSLGKFSGQVGPGPGFAFPIFQTVQKTVASLQTIDLPDQQIVLSGNIAVTISGNLNFKVVDPSKALLEVSDYRYSIRQLALTTIADVLGTKTIEDVRERKQEIADEIEVIISQRATEWGLGSVDIRLTDATMDESLLRAMMRETEARKEASALQIKAESDKEAAQMFSDAAETLAESPGAMTLRVLQTLNDLSNSKSTIVVPIPIDLMSGLGGPRNATSDDNTSKSKSSSDDVAPMAKLRIMEDTTHAICPHCQVALNVGAVKGNMRYDRMPEVAGQQLKCTKCDGIFTLPGTE